MYHNPVLLNESIEWLSIKPEGIYVDTTFGGGGHSKKIISKLTSGQLIAFDHDNESAANIINSDNFIFINHNFRFLKNFLRYNNIEKVDGILADLGVSSHQIDSANRGFSTRYNSNLDFRMNQDSELTGYNIINSYNFDRLSALFKNYGEIEKSKQVAKAIINYRENIPITTTFELKSAVEKFAPRGKENKFFAQLFQALRLEVNKEIEALKEMLVQSIDAIKPKGRLVIISYHSLEDRIVKNFIKTGNFDGIEEKDFYGNIIAPFLSLTRKPLVPSEEEINKNSRARSAKMRVAVRN